MKPQKSQQKPDQKKGKKQQQKKRQTRGVKFVRTKEGERRYGKPIGSVIVSDHNMENMKFLGTTKKGWGIFKGKNGKTYQVGKIKGLWVASPYGEHSRKHSLVEGGSLGAALLALNRRAGNKQEKRQETEYDRSKRRGGPKATETRTARSKRSASRTERPSKGSNATNARQKRRTSAPTKSSAPAKGHGQMKLKKGDYRGPNLRGLARLVHAGFGNPTNGAERNASNKVMIELQKQGLVTRVRSKGKLTWKPAKGYTLTDVVNGATETERIDKIMYDLQRNEEKAMRVFEYVSARADKMFAEVKGLTMCATSMSDLEQKDMNSGLELKVRRVRTQAGVRRFKMPIGSIITSKGSKLDNLTIRDSVFDGWDMVHGRNGKKYDVGRDGGKYRAYGHNDWDDMVAEGDSLDEVYEKLNAHVGGGKVKVPASPAKGSATTTSKPRKASSSITQDSTTSRAKAKPKYTNEDIAGVASAYKLNEDEETGLRTLINANPKLDPDKLAKQFVSSGYKISQIINSDRNARVPALPRARLKGARDMWWSLSPNERLDVVRLSKRPRKVDDYYKLRIQGGKSHREAYKLANAPRTFSQRTLF